MSLLSEYEACKSTEEVFFQCGALELAQKLLGKYLYCNQSRILLRIVETEAYPHGDEVYRKLFDAITPPIPEKAGVVVQLSAALHDKEPLSQGEQTASNAALFIKNPRRSQANIPAHLYITAGLGADKKSRDVVLLRSCEPHVQGTVEVWEVIFLRASSNNYPIQNTLKKIEKLLVFKEFATDSEGRNLLIHPIGVVEALAREWENNPFLYEEGGVQLFLKRSAPFATEPKMYGKRVLSSAKFPLKFTLSNGGLEDKLRFALSTSMDGFFKNSKELKFMPGKD